MAFSTRQLSVLNRVLSYDRLARLLLILTIVAGFLGVVLVVAQALLLSAVVDRIFIQRQAVQAVLPYLLIMIMIAVVRAAIIGVGDLLAQRSASRLKGRLRQQFMEHVFKLGPAFTRGEHSGELVNTAVEGVETLDEYVTIYQPLRFLAVIVPVFIALTVFALDPPTTLILIFTGPLLVLFLALIGSRAKTITERRFLELSWMSAFFLDILQGLATLKMFGRSREQIETIREVSQQFSSTTLEILRTAFQSALVLEWGGTVATALVAVEISLRLMADLIPFERAIAVLIITPEFFLPLRQFALRYHVGTAGKAAAERIFSILDRSAASADLSPLPARLALPGRLDIYFDKVSFAYEDGQRPALQDLFLSIPQGKIVALVGPTGAGKTTVANLLLRFIDPDRGVIIIDDLPLMMIDRIVWRAKVAWVPQHPYLFHGTVADNLRLARPAATQEDILAASRAAHAHEFIQRLPQGYDTLIGEQGARLSGGQQQRLAIARAFIKDAPFLILDEATSHLDSESEALIQDALVRLMYGRTVLIIAHRLKWAYAADHIVVMQSGHAIETGTHQALMAQDGLYRQLVASFEENAR